MGKIITITFNGHLQVYIMLNTSGLHVMLLLALTVFDMRSAQWTSTVTN